MVQNAYNFYWTEKMVNERLDSQITAAFHAVHEMSETQEVDTRVAAYLVAVSRVAEAVRLRGWV
jgi:glutamate dehydrogenase (NAD(P)+)